jgi:hypothetical protein
MKRAIELDKFVVQLPCRYLVASRLCVQVWFRPFLRTYTCFVLFVKWYFLSKTLQLLMRHQKIKAKVAVKRLQGLDIFVGYIPVS